MDHDQEIRRAKWLLGALGIFLISAFLSLDELRCLLWGRKVEGHVLNAKAVEISEGLGRSGPMLSVEYNFNDDESGFRSERDLVPVDWKLTGEGRVSIQHIPGKPDSSRLAGHRNMGSVTMFFGSLALISIFIPKLYLEAKRSERRPVRKGSR